MKILTVIKMMIASKVRFLKNLAYVCVGIALGSSEFVWFILALAVAIVLDALLTIFEVSKNDPPAS